MKGMQLELFGHQESKACYKCGEVKTLDCFFKDRSRRGGLQNKCKVCGLDYSKDYYQANKEDRAKYAKAYHQANKEYLTEYDKAYYKANKEAITEKKKDYYQANKESLTEYSKAYYKANKESFYEAVAKRRALKKSNTPEFILNCEVDKKRRVDTYQLRSLMTKVTGIEHHVDHMWPLSDGGPHWSGNLQVIPATDNLSKSASVDLEIKITIQEGLEYARQCYERKEVC